MPIGFSIGDFIAAGELAFRVYQNVYMVAKNAPEAVKKLRDELAILTGAIAILKGEVETPNSLINNAGEMRKNMVTELIKNVLNTLAELEELLRKYTGVSSEEVSKPRQIWARLKWTKEPPSVTTLLAKVEHYNSILNLLATSVGNSSLERIESTNRSMTQQLSELAGLLAATSIESRLTCTAPATHGDALNLTPPMVTIVKERLLQLSLSEKLMKNAECSRPWVLIGLDLWLQAGRWWLMKAQSSLHPFGSRAIEIGVQAYADLIKAYWIVVDIIAEHPQQKFLHGGSQRLETELLIETVKNELQKIQDLGLRPPRLSNVESADLKIWIDLPAGLDLKPKTASLTNSDQRLWSTPNEEIYFQRIGTYLPGKPYSFEPRSTGLCSAGQPAIILFLVDQTKRAARIVVQSQNMINLLTLPMESSRRLEPDINLDTDRYYLKYGEECFFFATVHECYLLRALVEGFRIYAFYCSGASANSVLLEAFIMLAAISDEEKSVVEFLLQNLTNFRSSSMDDIIITDILSLSLQVANRFLQAPLGPQIPYKGSPGIQKIPEADIERNVALGRAYPLHLSSLSWRYRLIKAPGNCIEGNWIDIFVKEGFDIHASDSSSDSPLHSAAAAGDLCALKALIVAGVGIDVCHTRVTAISQATLNGQHGAIQLLHDEGANLFVGDVYCTFFDCALYRQATAKFCINLPRFQINEPCENGVSKGHGRMTPIKVLISHYEPEIWATRMLCEAGAELNEVGIFSFVHKSWVWSFEQPEKRYKPYQSVLDRALERVGEARSEKLRQVTEKEFQEAKVMAAWRDGQDEDEYKDRSSLNNWYCQLKDRKVWEAEEVVRILQEFGAKLGERLPRGESIEGLEFQHSVGLKRRRSDSQ